jgi:hypothetical protein
MQTIPSTTRTTATRADAQADMLADLLTEQIPLPVARRVSDLDPETILWSCLPPVMRQVLRVALENPKSDMAKGVTIHGSLIHFALTFATPHTADRQRIYGSARASNAKRRLLALIDSHEETFDRAIADAYGAAERADELTDGTTMVSLPQLMLLAFYTDKRQHYLNCAQALLQAIVKGLGGDPASLSDDALMRKAGFAQPASAVEPMEPGTAGGEDEALNALAALDDDALTRVLAAERAYDQATDEWSSDWAADYEFEHEDDEHADDDAWALAQETPEWDEFCESEFAAIAAGHGVTEELLGHAVTVMNNGDRALEAIEHRRAERAAATTAGPVLH